MACSAPCTRFVDAMYTHPGCTLQVRAQLQGVHRLPVWAALEPPNAMHLPAFSAYPQLYVTAAGEHLMMLPQLLESLQAGPEEEQAEGDSEWLDRVSVAHCSMSCGSSDMVKQPCGCPEGIDDDLVTCRLQSCWGAGHCQSSGLVDVAVVPACGFAKHLQEDGWLIDFHHAASLPGTAKHSVGAFVGVEFSESRRSQLGASTAAPLARALLRKCFPLCALPARQTHIH